MRSECGDRVRLVRRGVGYAAYGPRFYVWDTEPRAVIDGALALLDGATDPRPAPDARRSRPRLRAQR